MARLAVLLGVALLLVGVGAQVAYAHADLREAYPAAGSEWYWNRPSEIRLNFTQDVDPAGSSILLVHRNDGKIETGPLVLDENDPSVVSVSLPALRSGTYTVEWKMRSVDGHTQPGSYQFTLFPREARITSIVAPVVLVLFGLFLWSRRKR